MKLLWALSMVATLCITVTEADSVYIVHMDTEGMPSPYTDTFNWYNSLCPRKVLYKYTTILNGFAAVLSDTDATELNEKPGVMHLRQGSTFTLETTHTPAFLNLTSPDNHHHNDMPGGHYGEGVIVGVIDTGVWPESRSFSDTGMSPPPPRWQGKCDSQDFKCNKKIIGARVFSLAAKAAGVANSIGSARDTEGHGTHTASTAAGSEVKDASVFGFARGTARGMAPKAWLGIYKTCWDVCHDADVLAGIDTAVADGVDVLSISVGGFVSAVAYNDTLSLGTLGAAKRGVFVAASAGNKGPLSGTVHNVAPWITTVAASTVDRSFPSVVYLGNGEHFVGSGLTNSTRGGMLPIYYSGNRTSIGDCFSALNPDDVRGKIVFCDRGSGSRVSKGEVVRNAGGVGMILGNSHLISDDYTVALAHVIPTSHMGYADAQKIKKYILSANKTATARIRSFGTRLGTRPAPAMARFSSRGPNRVTLEILKPDLTAPGHNILAAWPAIVPPSFLSSDKRRVDFNIISGTSMSCPHVAGIATVIKSAHPEWSPAAIRSALMTTASTVANDGRPVREINGNASSPFAYGAGHVVPLKALNPGLVYDLGAADYDKFLCSLNYTRRELELINGVGFNCTERLRSVTDLNYPSFSVIFNVNKTVVQTSRTVTNVGEKGVYKVSVTVPSVIKATVKPGTLAFRKKGEKRMYTVRFEAISIRGWSSSSVFGSLEWSDNVHYVRSPIAFTTNSIAN